MPASSPRAGGEELQPDLPQLHLQEKRRGGEQRLGVGGRQRRQGDLRRPRHHLRRLHLRGVLALQRRGVVERQPANRPYNFAVLDCVFEPAGSQCISWSGGRNPLYSIVDGCLFKGYGTSLDSCSGRVSGVRRQSPHRDPQLRHLDGERDRLQREQRRAAPATCTSGTSVSTPTRRTCTSRGGRANVYSTILGCDGMSYSRWAKCHFDTGDASGLLGRLGYTGEAGSRRQCGHSPTDTTTSARPRSPATSATGACTSLRLPQGTGPRGTAALTPPTRFPGACGHSRSRLPRRIEVGILKRVGSSLACIG